MEGVAAAPLQSGGRFPGMVVVLVVERVVLVLDVVVVVL